MADKGNFEDLRPADSSHPIRVTVCRKWAPPISQAASENFDRIFSNREPRQAGPVVVVPPSEAALAKVAYRENFDAIFGKRTEPHDPAQPYAVEPDGDFEESAPTRKSANQPTARKAP